MKLVDTTFSIGFRSWNLTPSYINRVSTYYGVTHHILPRFSPKEWPFVWAMQAPVISPLPRGRGVLPW